MSPYAHKDAATSGGTELDTYVPPRTLIRVGKTYLDHGGTTNPHSASTPSAVAGAKVDEVRLQALKFFRSDPEKFDLVFVSNASAAIKLVAECFRDYRAPGEKTRGGFWYGYHRDVHTSMVGTRQLSKDQHHCFVNDDEVNQWINGTLKRKVGPKKGQVGLFGFPGQSNMTGRRLPYLLDAAALATACPIDLSDEATAPDFMAVSFYKIFGFPNVGALIVRKEAGCVLKQRKYFGGGTVDMVITLDDTWHAKRQTSLHDQLEDGTLPFHSIFALGHAIEVHQRLFGSMSQISAHTAFLAKRLHGGMSNLTHVNGVPVCRIYKDPEAIYGDAKTQGATVAFNVQDSSGMPIAYSDVEKLADEHNLYLRSGGLCNPGGIATFQNFTAPDMKAIFTLGHRCSKPLTPEQLGGKMPGVVRVSLGAMSTISDVDIFLAFMADHYVETYQSIRESPMGLAESDRLELVHFGYCSVNQLTR
ncbi:PLP-dependent transferase [Lophium mytilinum]|uniref:PLP-dependent transferase n=1 Tax=Lophium mytilinum TaxID=390894 RepID=A0A6A6QRD3_9PEZI|nr:PLP-dependent transferase [Lophium mytilinum]